MIISRFGRVCLAIVVGALFVLGLVVSPLSLVVTAVMAAFVLFYRYAVASLTRTPESNRAPLSLRQSGRIAAGVLVIGPTIVGIVALAGPAVGVPLVAGAIIVTLVVGIHRTQAGPRGADGRLTTRPHATTDQRRPAEFRRSVTRATLPALPAAPTLPADPADLATPALCQAWRNSFVALERTPDPTAKARVVELRHRYLDELERRAPVGFTRWIQDGARAAGDPGPYVR